MRATPLASDAARRLLLAAMSLFQSSYEELVQIVGLPGAVVRPDKSTICDGRGLFATEALPAHSIVALYPVHAIGADDTSTGLLDLMASSDDMAYFDGVEGEGSAYRLYLRQPGYSSVCVDCNPNKPIPHPIWTGHLVNDAAMCTSREPGDVLEYLQRSIGGASCALLAVGQAPLTAVVTTRDVDAGEELFVTYGASYWVGGRPRSSGEVEDHAQYSQETGTGSVEEMVVERRSESSVQEAVERRSESSGMLDASYWESVCGPKATALLDQALESTRSAEEGVMALHGDVVEALDAGLEECLECVSEMIAAAAEDEVEREEAEAQAEQAERV